MKICTGCKLTQEDSEFTRSVKGRRGLTSRCKGCVRKWYEENRPRFQKKKWDNYIRNPLKVRDNKLRTKFGITLEQYNELSNRQSNVCAVCFKPEVVKRKDKLKTLAVDHCHETGKIRGLLCSKCNMAIGLVKDNVDTLLKMVDYLKAVA